MAQARHAAGHDHEVHDGRRSVWPLRPGEARGSAPAPGERFSLVALDAEARVSVSGARYPLAEAPPGPRPGPRRLERGDGRVRVQLHAGAVVGGGRARRWNGPVAGAP
jgi:hypothetical protein